jgi:hypothetical protein
MSSPRCYPCRAATNQIYHLASPVTYQRYPLETLRSPFDHRRDVQVSPLIQELGELERREVALQTEADGNSMAEDLAQHPTS